MKDGEAAGRMMKDDRTGRMLMRGLLDGMTGARELGPVSRWAVVAEVDVGFVHFSGDEQDDELTPDELREFEDATLEAIADFRQVFRNEEEEEG